METTNEAIKTQAIKFSAVRGISDEQDETSTLWLGRGKADSKNGRRDLQLSAPVPTISAEAIKELANAESQKLADYLSDELASYLRRVKCQRLEIGDSLELTLPAGGLELALTALITLTEGSRERKSFTSAILRDVTQGAAFKAIVTTYLQLKGIKPEAFKRIVLDNYLRASTRQDYSITPQEQATYTKALAHIEALAQMLAEAGNTAEANVITHAAAQLAKAEVIADDGI